MNMDVSNWGCSGCSLGERAGKFPCAVDYTWKTIELQGKKKVSFVVFPLFKTYTVTRFCSASVYPQWDWKDDVFVEENSFIVIALKSGYPLIESLIKHLQQKTVPLRELMVSSNIWFYSNSVLTDLTIVKIWLALMKYNRGRFSEWTSVRVPRRRISVSLLVLLLGFTGNFIHTFYDLRRGESTAVWPRHGHVD